MKVEIKERIENSVLLIMDAEAGQPPESMSGSLVVSNSSCIAVGTLAEMDGETVVVLTDERFLTEMYSNLREIFRGSLATPAKELSVCSIQLRPLLTLRVPKAQTALRVYANDESEPNQILVEVTDGQTLA
jgi:hypothetical protein